MASVPPANMANAPAQTPDDDAEPQLQRQASSPEEALKELHKELDHNASHRYEHANLIIGPDESIRSWLMDRINTPTFEKTMGALIMANFIIIAMQVDDAARCAEYSSATPGVASLPTQYATLEQCTEDGYATVYKIITITLLVVYTIEAACRLFVERSLYFHRAWNLLDIFVVVSGWLGEVVFGNGAMAFLRILRTARIVRAFRILVSFPELYYMVSSLGSLMKSLIIASGILFGLLSLWSIILVEYVHPISITIDWDEQGCERCARAYSSIMDSNLSIFQQLITGDSWGAVNIPIIEKEPWTAIILVSIVITIVFGLTNMILAVILQRAEDARLGDKAAMAHEKQKEFDEMKDNLIAFCAKLDKDQSGCIDLPELLRAWDDDANFRLHMKVIDIHKEDLAMVFRVLDKDNSGEVTYLEFCNELGTIQSRDINTMMALMRLSIGELSLQVHQLQHEKHAGTSSRGLGDRESTSRSAASPRTPTPFDATLAAPAASAASDATHAAIAVKEYGLTAQPSDKEPTIAERLFNQLCVTGCHPDAGGTPVVKEDNVIFELRTEEADALKSNLADYVEQQAASLVALLRAAESTPGKASAQRQTLALLAEAGRAATPSARGSAAPASSQVPNDVSQPAVVRQPVAAAPQEVQVVGNAVADAVRPTGEANV